MKHSFWRIDLCVIYRSGYRTRCKRCVQRWSFLVDWKRLMRQKDFSHSFWCTRDTWSFFAPNSVCFWRKGKCFALLSQLATFCFPSSYHICDQFLWTCPQKNICIANWLLLLKKKSKIKAERRRNHWRQKRVVFQKTFWTSPRKTGNFEGIVFFLCLVNEISRKSFANNYRSVEAKFILSKETLKTVNEFAFCLLIGQIGSSFFFFLWKKCFVSQLFFVFKRTLLIVLLQVRRMKVKATMRQISFGQKIRRKGKKLQYGWVSECWLWYDIGGALKVIANETQVLRTAPDS